MTCSHLKDLYQLCDTHGLKLSSSDLIRVICPQCGNQEICPSVHVTDYDAADEEGAAGAESEAP